MLTSRIFTDWRPQTDCASPKASRARERAAWTLSTVVAAATANTVSSTGSSNVTCAVLLPVAVSEIRGIFNAAC